MSFCRRALAIALCFWALACNSESLNNDPAIETPDDSGSETPALDVVPGPFARAELVPLYDAPSGFSATALAFDPARSGELWVMLRQFPDSRPCTSIATEQTGCSTRIGQIALVKQATSESPATQLKRDGNGWHFLRRPTAIAFGDNGHLATCGEARTDNYEDDPIDYSGPVLWSSDPAIFGVKPEPAQNGTHIDMLHETPYCMGIAHESANVYFAFNGQLGAVDRYDFKSPHVVGGEDHADGELYRFLEGELLRTPEIPSHMMLEDAERKLYIADTGHGRVVRLNVDSGTPGEEVLAYDPIAVHLAMDGAVLEEVVAEGVLTSPSGILVSPRFLVVTDNASSTIHWFDHAGASLGSLHTGLPTGSLSGIAAGPDGKLYLSDLQTGTAYRVEPR